LAYCLVELVDIEMFLKYFEENFKIKWIHDINQTCMEQPINLWKYQIDCGPSMVNDQWFRN
jgi:hypothetical protein